MAHFDDTPRTGTLENDKKDWTRPRLGYEAATDTHAIYLGISTKHSWRKLNRS